MTRRFVLDTDILTLYQRGHPDPDGLPLGQLLRGPLDLSGARAA